jgi:hypothetical protein
MLGGVLEQFHPLLFPLDKWLNNRLAESALWSTYFVGALVVLITIDLILQFRQKDKVKDFMYYPNVITLLKSASNIRSRMVIIIGFMLLFGNYTIIAVDVWRARSQILPLEISFKTCIWGWCVLWIADCLCRPRHISVWIAIGFLLFSIFVLPYSNIVRE